MSPQILVEQSPEMESVASCSPSTVPNNMVRMFPATETGVMIDGSTFRRLAIPRSGAARTRDDERDDAYGSMKIVDVDRWNAEPKRSHPIHEIAFSQASECNNIGKYNADPRRTERHRSHPPADWRRQYHHATSRGGYRVLADDPTRHSVGMVPLSHDDHNPSTRPAHHPSSHVLQRGAPQYGRDNLSTWPLRRESSYPGFESAQRGRISSSRGGRHVSPGSRHTSRVVIPKGLVIPRAISSPSVDGRSRADESGKRSFDSVSSTPSSSSSKKVKVDSKKEGAFEMLELLCSATIELGPLQENPAGCSCPKSKCIALYCDCFKAGRRCNANTCTCLDCKNTIEESGINGARSKAIQAILARNPRAFTNAGNSKEATKVPPGEQACNCIRSRCLKLYCTCFQVGKACNPLLCSCVGCLNTENDVTGMRKSAIEITLEKRPDAFKAKSKKKEIGSGCACKNNKCLKKYCECFRTGLSCTKKCCCRDCENQAEDTDESV